MNKIFYGLLIFLIVPANKLCNAQQNIATASFTVESHDFGKINESDGDANFKFTFTNTGGEPLILKNVTASCGCTTPSYSKEPVLPGAKGFIQVTYHAQGRPGHFEKIITVISNSDPEKQLLKITGEVIPNTPSTPRTKTIEELFPQSIEGLRLSTLQIAFGNIQPAKKVIKSAEVYNSTDQPMKITFNNIPKYLTVKIIPEILAPKEKGVIEVTYDVSLKNDWGFVVDNIFLSINNAKFNGSSRIAISANIVEDFSQLSDDQKMNAPKILFDNINFNFDTVKEGDNVEHDYTFKNIGKSDLIIHKVAPGCGCTVVNLKSKVIKPGESGSIIANFNTHGKSGNQNKQITVISNDPLSSHIVLFIKGVIK